MSNRLQVVRDSYRAYETNDRELIERVLAEDLVFSAPPDVGIDRATYFERCWPNAGNIAAFEFERLVEVGDEVLVTYESVQCTCTVEPPSSPVTSSSERTPLTTGISLVCSWRDGGSDSATVQRVVGS
jgi:ketosteroid isomerase-like protein